MFQKFAKAIVSWLLTHNIIDLDECNIFIYGLEIILLNGSLLMVFSVISILNHQLTCLWCYILFFIPLRIFSGGYHAKSSTICFICSIIIYCISIAIILLFPFLYQIRFWKMIGTISIIIISRISPLINGNHFLNDNQKKRNKIIVHFIILFDLAAFMICHIYNCHIATNILVYTILDALLLLIGKLMERNTCK